MTYRFFLFSLFYLRQRGLANTVLSFVSERGLYFYSRENVAVNCGIAGVLAGNGERRLSVDRQNPSDAFAILKGDDKVSSCFSYR